MKIRNLKYKILLIIFIIALISSIILSFVPLPLICTQFEGCNTVQTSIYAKTFGIENSYFGIVIFSFMSFMIYSHIRKPHNHKKTLISLGVFAGTMISFYFLYLQKFILHAYCKYCLVIDFGMVISFGVLNLPWKKRNIDIISEKNKVEIKSR
jgi:uncharacterized membrane protein